MHLEQRFPRRPGAPPTPAPPRPAPPPGISPCARPAPPPPRRFPPRVPRRERDIVERRPLARRVRRRPPVERRRAAQPGASARTTPVSRARRLGRCGSFVRVIIAAAPSLSFRRVVSIVEGSHAAAERSFEYRGVEFPAGAHGEYAGSASIPGESKSAPWSPTHDHTASLSLHVRCARWSRCPGTTERWGRSDAGTRRTRTVPFRARIGGGVRARTRRRLGGARRRRACRGRRAGRFCGAEARAVVRERAWGDLGARLWLVARRLAPLAQRFTVALPHGAEETYRWKSTPAATRMRRGRGRRDALENVPGRRRRRRKRKEARAGRSRGGGGASHTPPSGGKRLKARRAPPRDSPARARRRSRPRRRPRRGGTSCRSRATTRRSRSRRASRATTAASTVWPRDAARARGRARARGSRDRRGAPRSRPSEFSAGADDVSRGVLPRSADEAPPRPWRRRRDVSGTTPLELTSKKLPRFRIPEC